MTNPSDFNQPGDQERFGPGGVPSFPEQQLPIEQQSPVQYSGATPVQPTKKSRTLLIAGITGVVSLIIGIVIGSSGSSGDGNSAGKAPTPVAGSATPAPPVTEEPGSTTDDSAAQNEQEKADAALAEQERVAKETADQAAADKAQAEKDKQAKADAKKEKAAANRGEVAGWKEKDFKSISSRNLLKLVKNPDKFTGDGLVLWGRITQYDSATGECAFLASVASSAQSSWYDYDQNSMVAAANQESCDFLGDIVQDDIVKLWVTGGGPYSYDTQVGGNTTVPMFIVKKVKVIGSSD